MDSINSMNSMNSMNLEMFALCQTFSNTLKQKIWDFSPMESWIRFFHPLRWNHTCAALTLPRGLGLGMVNSQRGDAAYHWHFYGDSFC